jgi:hypothetical protein
MSNDMDARIDSAKEKRDYHLINCTHYSEVLDFLVMLRYAASMAEKGCGPDAKLTMSPEQCSTQEKK